jgi:hypothetical protein
MIVVDSTKPAIDSIDSSMLALSMLD